jgi:ubiquitin thioesterase protein OTUB1
VEEGLRCAGWRTGICTADPSAASSKDASVATSLVCSDAAIAEATLQQSNDIMSEIVKSQPAVGDISSVSSLRPQYESATLPGFIPGCAFYTYDSEVQLLICIFIGIDYLAMKYPGMRKVRGDGNCFYRAFLFAYLEQLLRGLKSDREDLNKASSAELDRFKVLISTSRDMLITLGYSEVAFEFFLDVCLLIYFS